MKEYQSKKRPKQTELRGRVACALSQPIAADNRPEVLRWLGGCRRLDALILPLGVKGGKHG